jgi:phosphoglycolate phosphatase-like HAD superfamily hydrolase
MSEKILFVWDFHGVLEKGNDYAFYKLFIDASKEFGLKKDLSFEDILELYGLKLNEIFKNFNPDISEENIDKIFSYCEKNAFKYVEKHISCQDEAKNVLEKIIKKGHENIIVSNTIPEMIYRFVETVNLTEYFSKIIGVDVNDKKIKAKNKSEAVIENIPNLNEYAKIVMIGDHIQDFIEGKKIKAKTYLFSKKIKECEHADYIISNLKEVLQEINN